MSNTKTKWMVTLKNGDNYDWIKDLATETEIHGSEIVEALIDRIRKDKDEYREFKQSLASLHTNNRLEELQQKRAALEEEIKKLQKGA